MAALPADEQHCLPLFNFQRNLLFHSDIQYSFPSTENVVCPYNTHLPPWVGQALLVPMAEVSECALNFSPLITILFAFLNVGSATTVPPIFIYLQ